MADSAVQSVTRRLIQRITAYSVVCVLTICVAQGWYSWHHMSEEFDKSLLFIGETQLPLLATSVWDAEPMAIERQLAEISQRPYIAYARLTADVGAVFEAGNPALHGRSNARLFNLAQPNDHEVSIGTLELVPDLSFLYLEIGRSVGFTLVGYVILCCLIILLLKREVERPLRDVLEYVTGPPQARSKRMQSAGRGEDRRKDEIDMVVEGFQTLHQKIDLRMRELDAEVESRTNALQSAMESIHQLSIMDPLTACYNRRLFNERIVEEAERAERLARPLTLVFADIDFFKRVNDNHGHSVGDQVLCHVSAIMRREIREGVDWVVRYGGEEFVLVLPGTDQDQAVGTAERVRIAIATEPLHVRGQDIILTCSFGVAQYQPGEATSAWLDRVDKCLYGAKQSGRNQVRAWENQDIHI